MKKLVPLAVVLALPACNAILGDDPVFLEASGGSAGIAGQGGSQANAGVGGGSGHPNAGSGGVSGSGQSGNGGGTAGAGHAGTGGTGGEGGQGGAGATGGAAGQGGAGKGGSGGTSVAGTGGSSGAGGAGLGGTSGAAGTTAAGSGGASGAGGTTTTGGSAGTSSGGTTSAGASGAGGTTSTGGAGAGGTTSAGGTSAMGGSTSMGGMSAGGSAGMGGATNCNNDGVLDPGEQCDVSDFGLATCPTVVPNSSGHLVCDASCNIVTTACAVCGDGAVNGDEACDDDQTKLGATCASLVDAGDTGTLKCTHCQFDTSACNHTVPCGSPSFDPLLASDWPMVGACATHPSRAEVEGPSTLSKVSTIVAAAGRPVLGTPMGGTSSIFTQVGGKLDAFLGAGFAQLWSVSESSPVAGASPMIIGNDVCGSYGGNWVSLLMTSGASGQQSVGEMPSQWTTDPILVGTPTGGAFYVGAGSAIARYAMKSSGTLDVLNMMTSANLEAALIAPPVVDPTGKTLYALLADGAIATMDSGTLTPFGATKLFPGLNSFSPLVVGADGSIFVMGTASDTDRPLLIKLSKGHVSFLLQMPFAGAPTTPALTSAGEVVVVNGNEVLAYFWDGSLSWKTTFGMDATSVVAGPAHVYVSTLSGVTIFSHAGAVLSNITTPSAITQLYLGNGYLVGQTATGALVGIQ